MHESTRYSVDLLVAVRVYADSPEEAITLAQQSTSNWDDWDAIEVHGLSPRPDDAVAS